MHKFNLILAAIIGGLAVLFVFQNLADVEVTFLIWNFHTKRYLVIMLAILAGFVIGFAVALSAMHHRRERQKADRDGARAAKL